mmetsp:Transcript_24534/g.37279  ORF Transcript_24534/g.37279 Transcript_24534/m.37279 type:complete len:109 (-) Transcript_24534:23-349(-)
MVTFSLLTVMLHLAVLAFQVASTRYAEALQNQPLFLASGVMLQVALCGNFFNEFRSFSQVHTLAFLIGFVVMMLGLFITSRAGELGESDSCREPLLCRDSERLRKTRK